MAGAFDKKLYLIDTRSWRIMSVRHVDYRSSYCRTHTTVVCAWRVLLGRMHVCFVL